MRNFDAPFICAIVAIVSGLIRIVRFRNQPELRRVPFSPTEKVILFPCIAVIMLAALLGFYSIIPAARFKPLIDGATALLLLGIAVHFLRSPSA